ncbi:MAG TPA: Holliday junction branch migration protein RuvA [Chitinophagaceae bacterium]|nr:Holliday junction branch migration protein RuvA [Chitinophagaceae bacterium]
MIAFVRGNFIHKSPAQVIVDVNGVGYELQISLNTYSHISNSSSGQLLTYLHITENGQTLFGFFGQDEKDLFLQLISVSGVGAATARMMLSGLKPDEIVKAIVQGNTKTLEAIKGIGRKTAERLILELKDKVGRLNTASITLPGALVTSIQQDALDALLALGIARAAAEAALKKAQQTDNITIEALIKTALKNL